MNLNLMTTNVCNFGCKYCYEGQFSAELIKERSLTGKTSLTIPEIEKFIEDYETAKGVRDNNHTLTLWGGEPLLNKEFCMHVIEHFSKDERFSFFTSTNGYYIPEYIEFFKNIVKKIGKERLRVQISYDGSGINEHTRVLKNGKNTQSIVLKSIKLLRDNNIQYTLKSVLPPEHFKDMFDAFKDVISLNGDYFPTPVYSTKLSEKSLNELKLSLMKIAKYIYDNNLNPEVFKWFTQSKAKCSAGINFFSINTQKEVVGCHAAMYEHNEHIIGKIGANDLIDKVIKAEENYQRMFNNLVKKCATCEVEYCLNCNYENYIVADKNLSYEDKWNSVNENFCKIFKLNSIIYNSLIKALYSKEIKCRIK